MQYGEVSTKENMVLISLYRFNFSINVGSKLKGVGAKPSKRFYPNFNNYIISIFAKRVGGGGAKPSRSYDASYFHFVFQFFSPIRQLNASQFVGFIFSLYSYIFAIILSRINPICYTFV